MLLTIKAFTHILAKTKTSIIATVAAQVATVADARLSAPAEARVALFAAGPILGVPSGDIWTKCKARKSPSMHAKPSIEDMRGPGEKDHGRGQRSEEAYQI